MFRSDSYFTDKIHKIYTISIVLATCLLVPHASVLPQDQEDTNNNSHEMQSTEKTIQRKEGSIITLDPIEVIGERPLTAASDSTIRNKDFMNFPRKSASDLMRFVPGLHITQHTGGAKAHQIFLRGFDAEHGQDIAAYIDGIPINEPSQVHGQGYLDLHFLIPESLEKIWIMKGPYDARYGNFASAGVINFEPYRKRDYTWSLSGSGGSEYTFDALGQVGGTWQKMDTYVVCQWSRTSGYTNPGELMAGRGFINHRIPLSSNWDMRILYTGYVVRSEAADILPKELIDNGDLDRFGSLDDSNRVDVDRHLAGLTLKYHESNEQVKIQAYYNYKRTNIFSNYTFYYYNDDPAEGDQLEQSDERNYYGVQGFYKRDDYAGDVEFSTETGLQIRNDSVDQTQANTHRCKRFNVINHYDFNETSLGAYLDERILLTDWCQLIIGARYDMILYNGDGTQDRKIFDIATNSEIIVQDVGKDFSTWAYALSPKTSVVFTPLRELSLFLNFGRGFVSTQARQMAWVNRHAMPAITGAEIGARTRLWKDRITIAASGWAALKDKEYIFDSEFGMSIERGKSRRLGFDFEFRIEPLKWLYLGADLNYVNAVFVETGDPVPNMSEWIMSNYISVSHPIGIRGSLRGRMIGPRTHDLDYRSRSYYILDLLLGYEHEHFSIIGSVENLFNCEWYDSVFAYESRPYHGGSTVEGLHVTPGNPTTWKLTAEVKF